LLTSKNAGIVSYLGSPPSPEHTPAGIRLQIQSSIVAFKPGGTSRLLARRNSATFATKSSSEVRLSKVMLVAGSV
jgi:hypothetical protein